MRNSMALVSGTRSPTHELTSINPLARSTQNFARPNPPSSLRSMTRRRNKNEWHRLTTRLIRRSITQLSTIQSASSGNNKNVLVSLTWLWSVRSKWRGQPTTLIRGSLRWKDSMTINGIGLSCGTTPSTCQNTTRPPLPISLTMILRVSLLVHPTPIWTEINHLKRPFKRSKGTTRRAPLLTKMSIIPGWRPAHSDQLSTTQSKRRKRAAL